LQPREPSAIDPIAEQRGVPTILMIASVARFRSQKSFDLRSSTRHPARFVLSLLHGARQRRRCQLRRRNIGKPSRASPLERQVTGDE
jgi:hypothetical protein